MGVMSERNGWRNEHGTLTVTRACRVCNFWGGEDDDLKDPTGTCRRYAPRAKSCPDDTFHSFDAYWPSTKASDWCGEFDEGADIPIEVIDVDEHGGLTRP